MVQLSGTVAERVYVGTTTQVIVELGPETRIVALEQNTHVAHAGDRWEIGHPVTLLVAAGALARAALDGRGIGHQGFSRRPVVNSHALQPTLSAANWR